MNRPVAPNILSSDQIRKLHKAPLYSVDGIALADGHLNVTGIVLAPDGEFSRVKIEADPGVSFSWQYPISDPAVRHYYWYWPNSEHARYLLQINLSECEHQSHVFSFRFRFKTDGNELPMLEFKDTFYVPKDIRCYQNFPSANSISRVQFFDSINSVVVNGYSDARRIRDLASFYGKNLCGARILDWGCGHGRIVRHFAELATQSVLHGVDIDADNITWMQRNLPYIKALHGPLMPPLPYDDNTFDFIFGISVMTHLTAEVRRAWLEELRRVSKANALLMLTFSGDTDVAFSSRDLDQRYIDDYLARGLGDDLVSNDLIDQIEDHSYYKNVKISATAVRILLNQYFRVIDVLECMFGYQDLVVMTNTKSHSR
jgi:SAM-dependent methyltransferase